MTTDEGGKDAGDFRLPRELGQFPPPPELRMEQCIFIASRPWDDEALEAMFGELE